VKIRPHRPRTVAGKTAAIMAVYLVAALASASVTLIGLRGLWPYGMVVVIWLGASTVGVPQLTWPPLGRLVLAAFASAFLIFPGYELAGRAILAVHGRPVTATVLSGEDFKGLKRSHVNLYRLAYPDGRPIPGELAEDDIVRLPGSHVDVVADPDGWVPPMTRGSMAETGPFSLVVGAGFLMTFAAAVWAARGRSEDPEPLTNRFGIRI